jgi:hypothetical protein
MRFPMRSFVLCREGVPVKNVGDASKVTLVATPIIPFDAENRGDNLLLDTNHFDLDICMLRWCNDAGRGQCNRYRRVNLASSGLSGATQIYNRSLLQVCRLTRHPREQMTMMMLSQRAVLSMMDAHNA